MGSGFTGAQQRAKLMGRSSTPPSTTGERADLRAEPRFRGTDGPGSDREAKGAVDHEVETFAKKIGGYLEKARTSHRYDRLHLIAPPKFLGQLRKELGKEVGKLVAEELPKDLSWLNAHELERKLFRSD